MRKRFATIASAAGLLLIGAAAAAQVLPHSIELPGGITLPAGSECVLHEEFETHTVVTCVGPPAEEPEPSTTTTTEPPATTTTEGPTTTTEPPATTTTTGPFEADACVLAQIEREPFNNRGNPKPAFDIILGNADTGEAWWTAEYRTDLGNGWGWISGDRAGYSRAYMFLVRIGDGLNAGEELVGLVSHRVYFQQVEGAAYAKINDEGMAEIQTTGIGFDGTCGNPPTQGQAPNITTAYEPLEGPEVRPGMVLTFDGTVIEDRSYTNTVVQTPGTILFSDGGQTNEPFQQANGFGDEHTVFDRHIALAHSTADDDAAAIAVYYDALHPDAAVEG